MMNEIVEFEGAVNAARPRRSSLSLYVDNQVRRLQRGYLNDEAWAVAAVAKLRRGVGKQPGRIVELLQWTSAGLFVEDFLSDEVSTEEWAAYTAITLYAAHQQSQRERMHRPGLSFGAAARELFYRQSTGQGSEEGVRRRFNAIGTATNAAELVRHASGMISQFRAAGIGLDYGLFADDLRKLRDPARAVGVRHRWGRHFYRPYREESLGELASAE